MFNLTSTPTRLLALSLLLMGCVVPQQSSTSVDASTFADRLSKGNMQLVDVRTAAEYAEGHIAGALNFDWTNGQLEQRAAELDKSKPVLLYCASGRRSAAAREYLKEEGFTDVVDLAGGLATWMDADMPVEH